MILRNGTAAEFFGHIAGKKLFIYGAGKNAHELFHKYKGELAEADICAIIDNNPLKKQLGVDFSGRILPIVSENEFIKLTLDEKKTALLITMGDFWGALSSLDSELSLSLLSCYIYPLIRMAEKDKGIYEEKIPQGSLKSVGDFLIPPIIHYCWFGRSEMPMMVKECIESWKKFCPDFEIRLWNEDNYDVAQNPYMLAAYKDKKWAYVSDYARVDVVNRYGGIYLDTDVEVLRPLDMLLREKAFAGFESAADVAFGLGFGARANNPILCDLLKLYDNLPWDGGKIACPIYQSEILAKHGMIRKNSFQRLENMTILPVRYLSPMSVNSGRKHHCPDSFAIHHYAASWLNDTAKQWTELKRRAVYGPW